MRYVSKRQYSWSSGIAYCVGLLASDGCLQKDGRHIDLTSNDYDQLTNFCLAIGRNITIGKKSSGNGKFSQRIQFSDVALYDFLLDVGLTPAKSLTIGTLLIPDEYYADFLRGLFDGDGTTYGFFDERWRSSFMFYMSFASASVEFLDYIRQNNIRLLRIGRGSLHKGNGASSLAYAKYDSLKLIEYMYYQSDLPFLKRKKDKLDNFVRLHQNAILTPG